MIMSGWNAGNPVSPSKSEKDGEPRNQFPEEGFENKYQIFNLSLNFQNLAFLVLLCKKTYLNLHETTWADVEIVQLPFK